VTIKEVILLQIKVSLKKRLKQVFCKHDRGVSLSCCTKGINSKQGFWYVTHECYVCGFAYGEWIEADKKAMEEMFEKEVQRIK
jgi:RNase P subunit RPR2